MEEADHSRCTLVLENEFPALRPHPHKHTGTFASFSVCFSEAGIHHPTLERAEKRWWSSRQLCAGVVTGVLFFGDVTSLLHLAIWALAHKATDGFSL